jgi:glycosyltransferase involved in cell wall biosynthesis
MPLKAQKVIWSIQDLWPFTGGCHYANECRGFEQTCADCPQVCRPFQRRVAAALQRKQAGLQGRRNLLLVAPSEWTRSLIQASAALRGLPTALVPNPVDTTRFSPLNKAALRAKWGVDPAAFVIGVGAADLRDERKQIPQTLSVLRDWMSQRNDPRPIRVLVFGAGGPLPDWPPEFRFLGPSPNAATLAEWYNAMDAYASLSRYETFGNTLAEAAACGTPSICLTGSGMAEVVVPDRTGRHVHSPDELPLALADWVERPSQAQAMGAAARQHALQQFNAEVVARQFLDLYGGSPT